MKLTNLYDITSGYGSPLHHVILYWRDLMRWNTLYSGTPETGRAGAAAAAPTRRPWLLPRPTTAPDPTVMALLPSSHYYTRSVYPRNTAKMCNEPPATNLPTGGPLVMVALYCRQKKPFLMRFPRSKIVNESVLTKQQQQYGRGPPYCHHHTAIYLLKVRCTIKYRLRSHQHA